MKPKKNSGMTLVELLAVILMTSMIMLSIGSVIYYTVDAVNLVEAIARTQEIERGIDRVLTEDMRLMRIDNNREFVVAKDRLADEEGELVSFVIDKPRFLDLEESERDVRVSYHLDASPDHFGEYRLLRRETSTLGEKKYTAVVYDRVLSAEVQFLDRDKWGYAWDARAANALPAAIKWNLEVLISSEYTKQQNINRKIEIIIDVLAVAIGESNDTETTEESADTDS